MFHIYLYIHISYIYIHILHIQYVLDGGFKHDAFSFPPFFLLRGAGLLVDMHTLFVLKPLIARIRST